MIYKGSTKNFRIENPKENPDKYKWVTLNDGDIVPVELEERINSNNLLIKKKKRIQNLKQDLDDDNKANNSHDVNKKSPGRKKKVIPKKTNKIKEVIKKVKKKLKKSKDKGWK